MSHSKPGQKPPVQSLPDDSVSQISGLVSMRLKFESVAFVRGADELLIPKDIAQRSKLITDIVGETEDCAEIHIPLSLQEVRAWLATASRLSSSDTVPTLDKGNEVLLQALKVIV